MARERDISKLATQVAEKYNRGIENVVEDVAVSLSKNIIERTPVGQPSTWKNPSGAPPGYVGGRARANWFPTIGTPSDDTTDSTNQNESASRITGIKEQIAGNVYYLTNNLPYIRRLEYDNWSKQAPRGMVRVTLREALSELKRAVSNNSKSR
jgi:hypothetical protein